MKNRYLKYVQIEEDIINNFICKHSSLTNFIDIKTPFFVRVYKKPYIGLIHTIIGEGEKNENFLIKWSQFLDCVKKIKPKCINKIETESLSKIIGSNKANLIKQISIDILNKNLNLKKLVKEEEDTIFNILTKYKNLNINTIKTFILFTCYKKNILCDTDPDFLTGLKIFLNKTEITPDDISRIKSEYDGELTLFSLCMWKIRNEKSRV